MHKLNIRHKLLLILTLRLNLKLTHILMLNSKIMHMPILNIKLKSMMKIYFVSLEKIKTLVRDQFMLHLEDPHLLISKPS